MAGPAPGFMRLLQLASPSLPVGSYAYSQGLERAIANDHLSTEEAVAEWLERQLETGLGRWDLPILLRLYRRWAERDEAGAFAWSRHLLAGRESGELLAEDRQQGKALARLLDELEVADLSAWRGAPETSLAAPFARGCCLWGITATDCASAYGWAWAEGQVAAAVKLVPLGQTAGQRLLLHLGDQIPDRVTAAEKLADGDLGGSLPGLALASAHHETQYTRLFRS